MSALRQTDRRSGCSAASRAVTAPVRRGIALTAPARPEPKAVRRERRRQGAGSQEPVLPTGRVSQVRPGLAGLRPVAWPGWSPPEELSVMQRALCRPAVSAIGLAEAPAKALPAQRRQFWPRIGSGGSQQGPSGSPSEMFVRGSARSACPGKACLDFDRGWKPVFPIRTCAASRASTYKANACSSHDSYVMNASVRPRSWTEFGRRLRQLASAPICPSNG